MSKSWFYVLLSSIIILKLLLSTLVIIKDRSNVEKVYLELIAHDLVCSDEVTIYRESTNGKITELNVRELNSRKNILQIKADNDKLFFKGIGIHVSETCLYPPEKVKVIIGLREYEYNYKEIAKSWQKVKHGSHWIFLLTVDQLPKTSYIPSIENIINWSGDKKLLKLVALDSSSLILLIIIILALHKFESKIFNSKFFTFKSTSILFITVIVFFIIFKSPFALQALESGLDPSWVTALNWANIKDYKWGEDIVFTYGPLYWFVKPSIILNTYELQKYALVIFLVYIVCVFVIVFYLKAAFVSQRLTIVETIVILSVLLLFQFEMLDYMTIATVILLLNTLKIDSQNKSIKIAIVSSLLAAMSLIKFSYIAIAISLIIIVGLASNKKNNGMTVFMQIGLYYALSLITLWVLNGQPVYNLYAYIHDGLEITSGYSEAMSTPIWDESTSKLSNLIDLIFLLITFFVLVTLLWIFVKTYKDIRMRIALLVSSPLIFLAFKEGFVRFDGGHLLLFYSQLLLLCTILFVIHKEVQGDRVISHALIIISGICCMISLPLSFFNKKELFLLLDDHYRSKELIGQKNFIKNTSFFTSKTKTLINNQSRMDIIPWDISLAYAYSTNWRPRPIFQSYSVYTPILADLNNVDYKSGNSPDYLLYSLKTIDNRYPLFDEPALNVLLLTQYEVIENNFNTYLVLRKRKENLKSILNKVNKKRIGFYDKIKIDKQRGAYTLMNINTSLTLFGKIANFLYKIPPLKIVMYGTDNKSLGEFRLIRKIANDKLLISSFVKDVNEFEQLFRNHPSTEIYSFSIAGNSLFYENSSELAFYFFKIVNPETSKNRAISDKTLTRN